MIVGIDLGTTNSLVAAWREGAAQIIPNALGEALTPSVVSIDDNGEVLVGRAARERLLTHPDRTAAAFKRYMGTNREIELAGRKFRPEELSGLVLKSLKADAENSLGAPVAEAVISVPAYFNDTQRKATRVAGELAGFKVERLINEPTAAALAYGLHNRDVESKFLIFDLGGGTFDVSVLELYESIMEVRASAGDNFLGGEDFVEALTATFLQEAGTGLARDRLDSGQRWQLHDQAERAKRSLTRHEAAEMRLRAGEEEIAWTVDEGRFETISAPLLKRLAAPTERALRDANFMPDELDEVLLVGGATRMPVVQSLVARMFGRLPARHLDPDQAVAMGAAVQAGLKVRDAALDEVVMTDVCPYTLGVEVAQAIARDTYRDGWFLPVIERNTTIPASRVEQLSTLANNQTEMKVDIYQGESRRVKDNIKLGEIGVKLPPRPAGEESVDIRFTYDINGLLEVEATVNSTGLTRSVVIEQNPGVLSPKEVAVRLKALSDLKVHPREQAENRALLARAERLYEERLGDLRDYVGQLITQFEAILARQDPGEIEDTRNKIAGILNEIEGEAFF